MTTLIVRGSAGSPSSGGGVGTGFSLSDIPYRGPSIIITTTHAAASGGTGWATDHTGENLQTDGKIDTYSLAPVAAPVYKWATIEDVEGALNATSRANLDANIAYARSRTSALKGAGSQISPFGMLLRVSLGIDGPFGSDSAPGWGTTAGVATVALNKGNAPLPWDPVYRTKARGMWDLVASYLAERDKIGRLKGDYFAAITLSSLGGFYTGSSEMHLTYNSGDQAAWDAITSFYPAGVTSSGDKELYRARRYEAASRDLIADQLEALPNHFLLVEFGDVFGDVDAISRAYIVGRQLTTGSLQAVSGGATTINFNGSPGLLTNGAIGGLLYRTQGGVHQLMGEVADIKTNTQLTLVSGALVAASNTDTYSLELAPLDTDGGRLVAGVTNYEIDEASANAPGAWRGYAWQSPNHASCLDLAYWAGWKLILQSASWTGGVNAISSHFSTDPEAALRATAFDAIQRYDPAIIEYSGSAWGEVGQWFQYQLKPLMQGGFQ